MKKVPVCIVLSIAILLFVAKAPAQTPAASSTPPTSMSKSLGLYVFPAKNQNAQTQSKDEKDCYDWAVQQSGVDPINPPKVEAQQVEKGPDGSAVVGGAKGAAAGAAIGAIAGDAGKGAAIGAVAGGVAGRRASKQGQAQAQKQSNASATQKEQELMNNFKKAYTACLEAKGYTVK